MVVTPWPCVFASNVWRLPEKTGPSPFALPPIENIEDLSRVTSALITAVAEGELPPIEAAELSKLVDAHIKAIEVTDLNVHTHHCCRSRGAKD
ncbi:hypothetical protein GCM10019059_45010 [Camelimonas fluminis]|nr:hypothetical protein GCM10019059_45010 [Camelimonas fluminis]